MASPRASTRYAAALRGVFGVAALLGLFAMHGLAAHGTAHEGHAGEPMAVMTAVVHSSGHSMTPSGMTSSPAHDGSDGGLLGVAGMCLAVLLVGAVLAVLLGRGAVLADLRDATVRAVGWAPRSRRDRDPPCLFALSIQRC